MTYPSICLPDLKNHSFLFLKYSVHSPHWLGLFLNPLSVPSYTHGLQISFVPLIVVFLGLPSLSLSFILYLVFCLRFT